MNWTEGNLARYSNHSKKTSKGNKIINIQRHHFARVRNGHSKAHQKASTRPTDFFDGLITNNSRPSKKKKRQSSEISSQHAVSTVHENSDNDRPRVRRKLKRLNSSSDVGLADGVDGKGTPEDLMVLEQRKQNLLRQPSWISMNIGDPLGLKFNKPIDDSSRPLWKSTSRQDKQPTTKRRHRSKEHPQYSSAYHNPCPTESCRNKRRVESKGGEEDYRIKIGSQIEPSITAPSIYTDRGDRETHHQSAYHVSENLLGSGRRTDRDSVKSSDEEVLLPSNLFRGHGVAAHDLTHFELRRSNSHRSPLRFSKSTHSVAILQPMPKRPGKSKLLRAPTPQTTSSIGSINVDIEETEPTIPQDLREENDKWKTLFVSDANSTAGSSGRLGPKNDGRAPSPGISEWRPNEPATSPRDEEMAQIRCRDENKSFIPSMQENRPRIGSWNSDSELPKILPRHHKTSEECQGLAAHQETASAISNRTGPSLLSLSDSLDPHAFGLEASNGEHVSQAISSSEYFASSPPIWYRISRHSQNYIGGTIRNLCPVREDADEPGAKGTMHQKKTRNTTDQRHLLNHPDHTEVGDSTKESRWRSEPSIQPAVGETGNKPREGTWMQDVSNKAGPKVPTSVHVMGHKQVGNVKVPFFTRPKSPPLDLEKIWQKFVYSSGSDDGMEDATSEAKHEAARSIVPTILSVGTEQATTSKDIRSLPISACLSPSMNTPSRGWNMKRHPVQGLSHPQPAITGDHTSQLLFDTGLETLATCGTIRGPGVLGNRAGTPTEWCITHVTTTASGSSVPAPISPRVEIKRQQTAWAVDNSSLDPLSTAGPWVYDYLGRSTAASIIRPADTSAVKPLDTRTKQGGIRWAPPPRFTGNGRKRSFHDEAPRVRSPGSRGGRTRRNRYVRSGRTDIRAVPDFDEDPIEE